jgi:uncharacterized protein
MSSEGASAAGHSNSLSAVSATGPTALITGASSGIGEAAAKRLAREPGARLILVARREDRLRALAESLPCDATHLAVDLTSGEAPERVRAHVAEQGGRLSLLVNNAGASWRGSFAEGGYANVRRHMELNFDAVVRLTEALLPALRDSTPSAIVNVASVAGRVARARTGAYSASKSALSAGPTRSTPRSARTASTSAWCYPASSPPRASRRPSCASGR